MFINKEHIKEKIDKLEQIKRMIGAMMMLTTNTKRIVANFTSSRFSLIIDTLDSEGRLYLFTVLEAIALILVSLWQVWYVRRLVLKRRIL